MVGRVALFKEGAFELRPGYREEASQPPQRSGEPSRRGPGAVWWNLGC